MPNPFRVEADFVPGGRGDMSQYIAKRALASLLVLFIISIIVFLAVRAIPGSVCTIVLQTNDVDKQQCDAINKELGIDKPVVTQYFVYMGNVLTGDFGKSLITKKDVWEEMRVRIPLTIELTLLATSFAVPRLGHGELSCSAWASFGSSRYGRTIAVTMKPGQTAVARIRCFAKSTASCRVRFTTPPFEAQ